MSLDFAPVSLACVYGMTWKQSVRLVEKATLTPVDLTGVGLVLRIREFLGSNDALMELSTENGRLAVIDALDGRFDISVPKEVMQELPDPRPSKYRKYVYDMTIIRGIHHEPGIRGRFRLSAQVTRAWQPLTT